MSEVPSKQLLDELDTAIEDCRKLEVILEEFDASADHKSNLLDNM